jgi:hypothetical protein
MIEFDSLEGQQLRAMQPSQSATMALWLVALTEGNEDWATWAQNQLDDVKESVDVLALCFIKAVCDTETKLAKQLWSVLASFPISGSHSHIIRAARTLQAQLPI